MVDAAGAWARVVAAGLGAALPVVPTRHQHLITEPIAGVGPEFPIARVIDAHVYVRHERGGLMLGGYEAICREERFSSPGSRRSAAARGTSPHPTEPITSGSWMGRLRAGDKIPGA